ncbi:MAG: hypothetical protein ACRDCE_20445 [Cetobacterium sp.]|uniref:hypothetical protein n=1 Tax=Cetobacterium sp. TaxID=2071632 RepID=UPI003EE7BEB0
MNKELLEILLQFFNNKPGNEISNSMCGMLNDFCGEVDCENCAAGRITSRSFISVHKKLDQIQITLKVITDEP